MSKLLIAAMLLLAAAAMAQQPAPAPRNQDIGPRVDTSAPAAQPASAPAPQKPQAAPQSQSTTTANNPAKPARRSAGADRLDLDAAQITASSELPKVMYVVPWRSAELGDLVGRPVNSLLDEVLEPVDRDVFRRQNRYFEALQSDGAAPAGKPEK